MSTLRKQFVRHEGLTVNYNDDVTEDQVRKIEDFVRVEFETGEWVTVEQDS